MTVASQRRAALGRRRFRRILLIKPSSLGDLVHALPVLHGLRARYPGARIDWLAATSFAPLVEGHPEVAEVVRFDRRRFGRMLREPRVGLEFAGFLAELHRRRYDLVVDLQGLFRSGVLALATGAPVRIGFGNAREAAWLFYTHPLRPPAGQEHAVERNYAVAGLLGFDEMPPRFDLAVRPAERSRAATLLAEVEVSPAESFAAILPGARWETKRWPTARFAAVVDALAERGLRSVLLAGPDEAGLCRAVAERCRTAPADLAGRTGLRELIAVLERASVVLCHDSAPMHLAAALNRPLVAILGPTNPRRTGPYGPRATVLQADLPCAPCYLRRLSQCRHRHLCMQAVTVEEVLAAVERAADCVKIRCPVG